MPPVPDIDLMTRVISATRALRGRLRWTPARLAAYRAEQLARLREHAYRHSPFYQHFHRGRETQPLESLPVVTKSMVMRDFDAIASDPAIRLADVQAHLRDRDPADRYLGRYIVTQTAGSTGHPGVVLHDLDEWAAISASFGRIWEWAGAIVDPTRPERFAVTTSAVATHQSARLHASFGADHMKRLDPSADLDVIVDELNAWQPTNLSTFTWVAGELAREQLAGRLRIAPRRVLCGGEPVTAQVRTHVAAAWPAAMLFEGYGATEAGVLASECHCHRLHLFDDLVITEIVDEDNRPVPPGCTGAKVLVTVLFGRTLPLIRYVLSDRTRMVPVSCECGLPFGVLGGVEGRDEDVLRLSARAGDTVAIRLPVLHRLLDGLPARAWQIWQAPDRLRLLLARLPTSIDTTAVADSLAQAFAAEGAAPCRIDVERVDTVVRTRTGKTPLIGNATLYEMTGGVRGTLTR